MNTLDEGIKDAHGRIPFIIGLTGHRFVGGPNEQAKLFDELKQSLLYWHKALKRQTPIYLLTGLAEGADLLAVDAAMALQAEFGSHAFRILATLPMPKEAFEQDFAKRPEAHQKFTQSYKALVNSPNKLIVLKNDLPESAYKQAQADANFGELRSSLYLNQSLFIAKYSNVLLAAWDGNDGNGAGGTADAVKFKLGHQVSWPANTGNPALEAASEFDGQVGGLVHHILCANENSKNTPKWRSDLASFPVGQAPNETENSEDTKGFTAPAIGKLYSYSAYPSKKADVLSEFISAEFNELLTELNIHNESKQKLDKSSQQAWVSATDIFNVVDNMALEFQSQYRRLIALFFMIILPGFVAYELAGNYNNQLTGSAILLGILLVLIASSAVIRRSRKLNLKWRYQLARGIVEGIRIRLSLNEADVPPSAEPLIPRKFRAHLPLINQAISLAELEWWDESAKSAPNSVNDQWIKPQIGFLNSRLNNTSSSIKELLYKRPLLAAQKASSIATFFFYTAIGVGSLLCISIVLFELYKIPELASANNVLMYLIQYSLLVSGVVSLWSELAGYSNTAMGYKGLKDLYVRASVLLEQECHNTPKTNNKMLLDLAREAMVEHITWNLSEIDNDLKQK